MSTVAMPEIGSISYNGISFEFLRRYRKFGIDIDHISEMPPLLVRHKNVAEYVVGLNPQIVSDTYEIRKACRKWKEVLSRLNAYGSPVSAPPENAIAIAYYYPDIVIISSRIPKIPYVPEWFGFVADKETVIIKKDDINNLRRLYVDVLKVISRAVIVKPIV